MCSAKIKHIPDKAPPYIRTGRDCFPVFNVIIRLPVFRMPPTSWYSFNQRILLMVNTCAGTIFTDSNTYFRMILMHSIQPFPQISGSATIPSIITVPSNSIRYEIQISHLITCGGRRPGSIFLMCQHI